MNLGLLTSYGLMCGVAEHAANLANAMRVLGHRVTVFGNYGIEHIRPEERWRVVPADENPALVVRCFHAAAWSTGDGFDLDLIRSELIGRGVTTLLVQYEQMLYAAPPLVELVGWCRASGIHTVVTFHDSLLGGFPRGVADVAVVTGPSLRWAVPDAVCIPHGVHDLVLPSRAGAQRQYGLAGEFIATLGLGRTDYRLVYRVARRHGWKLLAFDPTGGCRVSGSAAVVVREWLPQAELIRRLAVCRGVVLWYPPVHARVCSGAAHLAVASRRPVYVNTTNWFADLPPDVFFKARTEAELDRLIARPPDHQRQRRQDAYIKANSWTQVALRYLELCR